MKLFKTKDVFLNIALPVLAGAIIYLFEADVSPFIKNYFPDALWAYAFASSILIIWHREVNVAWLAVMFVAGDWWDIAVYSLSFSGAVFLNQYFKHTFQKHNSCNTNP